MNLSPTDREYLIRTVVGESGNQSDIGKAAVAHVILNRMKSGKYGGRTAQEVVLAPSQFEPWSTRKNELLGLSANDPGYQRAAQVVDAVLSGQIDDPTKGATHFLNEKIVRERRGGSLPSWANSNNKMQIGDHTFLAADGGGGVQVTPTAGGQIDWASKLKGAASTSADPVSKPATPQIDWAAKLGQIASPQFQTPEPPPGVIIHGQKRSYVSDQPEINVERSASGDPQRTQTEMEGLALRQQIGDLPARGALPFVQGQSFNFADELISVLSEAAGGPSYDQAQEVQRQSLARQREESPLASLGTEIAGGVSTPAIGLVGLGAKALQGGGKAVRATKAAGVGATLGGISGAGGAREGERGQGAATGAAFGAFLGPVFEMLGAPAIKFARAAGNKLRNFVSDQDGTLTREGRVAAERLGLNANEISDNYAQAFAERLRRTGDPNASARQTVADEFGIPLTKGQATGDEAQIAFEEAARNNARGSLAKGAISSVDEAAEKARQRSTESLKADFGGGNIIAPDQRTAGEALTEGIKSRAASMNRQIDAAYDKARPVMEQTFVDVNAVTALPKRLKSVLNDADVVVDELTPATARALRSVNELVDQAKKATSGDDFISGGVNLRGMEQVRRRINNAFDVAANKGDRRALTIVKREFDTAVDDAVDTALYSGDPDAMSILKEARGLRAQYARMFQSQGSGDRAGKILEKMIQDNPSPEQVSNWLYGSSQVGMKEESRQLAKRIKSVLGADSTEWNAVRQGAWNQITAKPEGTPQPSPHMVAKNIMNFLEGNGKTLANELYTPVERAKMKRFAKALQILVPPATATNPSKTAYGMARLGQDMMSNFAAAMGFSQGGPIGAGAAKVASTVGPGIFNGIRAARSTAGAPARQNVGGSIASAPVSGAASQYVAGER